VELLLDTILPSDAFAYQELRDFSRIHIVVLTNGGLAMFDAYITHLIREEEKPSRQQRMPFLELPLRDREPSELNDMQESPVSGRGVTIIEPDED
jgi:hypothetical protein